MIFCNEEIIDDFENLFGLVSGPLRGLYSNAAGQALLNVEAGNYLYGDEAKASTSSNVNTPQVKLETEGKSYTN